MIPSSLRHTQRHHLHRIGKRCLPSSNNNNSRFIFHHDNTAATTTRFIAGDATTKHSSILHHVSKRRNYNAISGTTVQQFRRMMMSDSPPENNVDGSAAAKLQDATTCAPIENLDECYSSPLSLLEQRNIRTIQRKKCDAITINNETWYTAAYETNYGIQHSGTFGDVVKKFNPTLANEERININGINYYKTIEVAREAAAARVVDLLVAQNELVVAFGGENNNDSAAVVPLRYCVEEPEHRLEQMAPIPEKMASYAASLENFAYQLHNPLDFLMGAFKRIHRLPYTDSIFPFKLEMLEVEGRKWFTATLTDPATKETFQSGLVKPLNNIEGRFEFTVNALPPGVDDVRIKDGKVYYASARNARHAAAARAIDCYLYREGADDFREKYQLCLEEPYFDNIQRGDSHQCDYNELLRQRKVAIDEMPDSNHVFTKLGDKSFKSTVNAFPYQLHTPISLLETCYRRAYYGSLMYSKEAFQCDRVMANGREWFTATFTDPATKEVFSSGLVRPIDVEERRGSVLSSPLGQAEVRIMGGKVYYAEEKFARHAAAARAIDCFLHREGSDSLTKEYQLCFEAPYRDAVESSHQYDYDELLRQRKVVTKEILPDFDQSNHLFTKRGDNSFKSVVNSFPYQLHTPAQMLENCYRQVYDGGSLLYLKDAYQCDRVMANGREWFTATFTDPITSELFPSGLVRPIDVEERRGSVLSTPLGEAEVRIMGEKVYYAEEKFARHAAAARAIDCFLHREGSDSLTKEYQLCLEAPYRDAVESSHQYDYNELLRQRKVATKEMPDSNHLFTKIGDNSFKSVVNLFLYQLHTPAQLLENCYRQVYGHSSPRSLPKEAFQCDRVFSNGRGWFTATFTDPITSEVFSSGLARPIDVETRRGTTLSTPLGEAEVRIMDGKVYYADEKLARHAAAARAIDCFLLREGSDSLTKEYQLCFEAPYSDTAERDSRYNDYDELLRRRRDPNGESDIRKLPGQTRFDSFVRSNNLSDKSFTSEVEDNAYKLHIPMQLLNFKGSITGKEFRTEEAIFEDLTWHTATFTDPNTSEVFTSGIGRRVDVKKKQGAFLSPSISEVRNRVADGKVYYRDKKLAKHAAAARAIDCYLYRETGALSKNQLCLEDPYEVGGAQDIDYDALAASRANVLVVRSSHLDPYETESPSRREMSIKSVAKWLSEEKSFKSAAAPTKSFKSVAENTPFQLHVPVTLLEKSYKQVHGFLYPKEAFKGERVMANEREWFTATFTDPITSEVFSSGLVRPIDVKEKKGATLSTPLGQAEVHIMDGKVYYADEKFARHAAAARAIDCFLHREGSDSLTKEYQLCLEAPYRDDAERDSRYNDYDELLRRRRDAIEKSGTKPSQEEYFWKLHVPVVFLKSYLRERYDFKYYPKCIANESVEIGRKMWHTATFTDPNTSEVFPAGLVGPINAMQRDSWVLSPTLDKEEVRISDGRVYYAKLESARQAAAARAIDCYLYRDAMAIGESPKYQLCLEDPYRSAAERYSRHTDYDELLRRRRDATSLCRFADMKPPPEEYCDLVASRDNTNSLDSTEDMMPYLDESDEDFTIVSRTYSDQPTRVDQTLSTLGRIAEIWAETPTNASSGKASVKTASFTKASRDPTENILNWFNRVDHIPSNFEQALAFSQLCNKTLLALANENTEKVINPKKCADIQREAKSILDKLTSISSQFADKDESVVNSETLNAYIQCLSRIDAEKSATVAEGLLKSMSEGKDNLPSPNAGTYNAVMKLWSSVDGEKGKNGVNDTFSLLQNAAVAREDLRPNRVSFQILLAANAKENNHFKYDLALASLERIKALSQDLCGEAFTPLADDYNAALKKTATNCLPDGDYYPPWVWYGQQYDGGFVAMDDDKKCEALDMEKWLEHAEAMGASPSEDMYFQVIKAWTSTGSLEGLIGGDGANGAEELAKKAVLRSEGAPDMKIFYPIIAAWSLCGEKLGPDRVKEWIDQISLLGMKPDLDLQLAYFVAVEKCQSKLIDNMLGNNDGTDDSLVEKSVEVASTDGDIESLFKAAHNCSRYLEEMTSAKNRQDIANLDAFTAMLRYSIKAWSRASHSTLLLPDGSTPLNSTQGVKEMAKVLKRISLRNHGQDSADIDEALVNAAGTVCTEFTSQLRKLDSTRNKHFENNEKCHFAERIADVESSLRSYEFHSRRLASNDKLLPESNDIRHNLYRETLRGCAGVKLSTDYGHVLRICTLIMDCLSWHHELTRDHGSGREVEDVTDIYSDIAMISGTCVKSPYERMNVLRSIYERASDFFPKKNPHHESSYARVDRAALLGSMRRSLGDSEMTDSFLSSFEEGKQGQRRRSRHRGNS